MLGLVLTLAFSSVVAAGISGLLTRRCPQIDPAEAVGVGGILGLGAVGWLMFFVGLIPGGFGSGALPWVAWVVIVGVLVVSLRGRRLSDQQPWRLKLPKTPHSLFLAALGLLALIPLVNALSPSDSMDWDTLAYHLAVPKLWMAAGQITFIPFIHHSNFPFVVDNLYVLGLDWGGESGAKAFTLAYFLLGEMALFGLARRWFGGVAGWWTALAFAGMPVVLWESGSGYIDVAHGLFAGLCILYVASYVASVRKGSPTKHEFVLACALGGLACASKYTGLQVVVAAGLVAGVALLFVPGERRGWVRAIKVPVLIVATGLAIASPWLIRNVVNTGNPVYPFFYERLGGKNWDSWRSAIYRDEQQTFGVGRTESGRNPAELEHGVLGLTYQPGRYVNPGQTEGNGFPMGAIGAATMLGALAWLISGKRDRRVGFVLASVGVMFLMWFFLSQQSRYAVSMMVPACVLLGGAATQLPWRLVLRAVVAIQAAYSAWLLYTVQTSVQLPAALGRVSRDEYLAAREPFYAESKMINDAVKGGRVALFDQVFGYYLDVAYFWANPGHCTLIPYDRLSNADGFVASLRSLGMTHVYVNLLYQTPELRRSLVEAAASQPLTLPLDPRTRDQMNADLNTKWKVLLLDALVAGRLRGVSATRYGVLAEIAP